MESSLLQNSKYVTASTQANELLFLLQYVKLRYLQMQCWKAENYKWKLLKFGTILPQSNMLISSVQSLSHVRLFATPWIAAHQATLSIISSRSLFKLMLIESGMPSSHLILCRPLLLLPPIPPSIRVFSNESTLRMRWPKYWSFSFSISPSNEHPGLISLRMDWLDLLAVHGTLKSLLQHHSSKASIFQCSALFIVQCSWKDPDAGKDWTQEQMGMTEDEMVG